MLPSGSIGYVLLLLSSVALVTRECEAAVAPKPNESRTETNSSKVVARALMTNDDEDEDFVPYQGERFNIFDWNLLRTMGSKYPGNLLISPVSIKVALVLLYEGAQDQTAHELAGAMQLPVSRSATRDKFTNVLRSLKATSPAYTLDIGTRLYIDDNVLTRQRYSAIAKTFYDTDVINANLSDAHTIVDKVNTWVRNITHGGIDKMIEDERSIERSVMLVINAIFFKGTWRRNFFLPNNTIMDKFYVNNNEIVNVPFMRTVGRFYYSESAELDAKILRIPYDGQKYSMYVILPSSLMGLNLLLKEINPFILSRHVWLMQDLPVDVKLPKFKFDFTSHLEATLRELGIRDIFDDTATLTGIARTKRTSKHLIVSEILQKTGIEVNEKGTTAYAASQVLLGNKVGDQTFHADRPFLFFIEDETTGTVLFMGKVMNPLQTSGSTENLVPNFPSRFGEETPSPMIPIPGKSP